MTKQSNKGAPSASKKAGAAKAALDTAAANLPVDPKSDGAAKNLNRLADSLPKNPKAGLVDAFKQVALVIGADEAKRLLVEEYGTEEPEKLKASQLMDAIDALYGYGAA